MRRFFAWVVLAPLGVVLILLAVANRRTVTLSVDPFSQDAPAYAVDLPLFVAIFVALIVGVLIGGIAVWFGKLRWRLAARRAEREAARLRAERSAAQTRAHSGLHGPQTLIPPS
jgi:uncharacterized integral membrane protein